MLVKTGVLPARPTRFAGNSRYDVRVNGGSETYDPSVHVFRELANPVGLL